MNTSIFLYRVRANFLHSLKDLIRPAFYWIRSLFYRLPIYLARLLRYLPFGQFAKIETKQLFPPVGICLSTAEWVSQASQELGLNATFIAVDAETEITRKLPKTIYPDVRHEFKTELKKQLLPTFVTVIPNGRVWGHYGAIITPDNLLLKDISEYHQIAQTGVDHQIFLDWRLVPLHRVSGTVAVLSTDAAGLYYHWMFHQLPRFELLRRGGFDLSRIDKIIVSSCQKAYQRDTLQILGITENQLIESDKFIHIEAENLIVPSNPLLTLQIPKWICDFLRTSFLPRTEQIRAGRRIYISRGQASYRRVLNEGEVIEFLSQYGFENVSFENLLVSEQALLMASAEVVIGPHGSGLSNIVFCNPKTKIVEIFSPELVHHYFWKISDLVDLDYYYILGKGSNDINYQQSWDAKADIQVELGSLKKVLREIGIV
jgi:capsular polysaccharide biosynthesis protein